MFDRIKLEAIVKFFEIITVLQSYDRVATQYLQLVLRNEEKHLKWCTLEKCKEMWWWIKNRWEKIVYLYRSERI